MLRPIFATKTSVKTTKMRSPHRNTPIKKNPLFGLLDKETAAKLEAMRYGNRLGSGQFILKAKIKMSA